MSNRRCHAATSTCSCRACVCARWEAALPNSNRTGRRRRQDSSSNPSSNEDWSKSDGEAGEEEVPARRPFRGFVLVKAVDHFASRRGGGPEMRVEARDLPSGGTEQTLLLDELKLSVVEQSPAPPHARGESRVTVSRRRAAATAPDEDDDEVIFTSQNLSRGPARSLGLEAYLDGLAAAGGQARVADAPSSDAPSVVPLLEGIARKHGLHARELLDAVQSVAPPEIGCALAGLCSSSVASVVHLREL